MDRPTRYKEWNQKTFAVSAYEHCLECYLTCCEIDGIESHVCSMDFTKVADSFGDSPCDFLSCRVAGGVQQQNPMVVQGAVVQGQVIGIGWTKATGVDFMKAS